MVSVWCSIQSQNWWVWIWTIALVMELLLKKLPRLLIELAVILKSVPVEEGSESFYTVSFPKKGGDAAALNVMTKEDT